MTDEMRMTDKVRMTDDEVRMTDDKVRMTDDKVRMTDNKVRTTDDKVRTTDNEMRMTVTIRFCPHFSFLFTLLLFQSRDPSITLPSHVTYVTWSVT